MAWTGQANYMRTQEYAGEAAAAHAEGDLDGAAVLAAIGQVHATLALAAATALHEEHRDIRAWREATGQE